MTSTLHATWTKSFSFWRVGFFFFCTHRSLVLRNRSIACSSSASPASRAVWPAGWWCHAPKTRTPSNCLILPGEAATSSVRAAGAAPPTTGVPTSGCRLPDCPMRYERGFASRFKCRRIHSAVASLNETSSAHPVQRCQPATRP